MIQTKIRLHDILNQYKSKHKNNTLMAAKDYVFVTGWRDAYLAKRKKSNSPTMSVDRRIIEDHEILGLFEFYLRKECSEHKKSTVVITKPDGTPLFDATLLDRKEE